MHRLERLELTDGITLPAAYGRNGIVLLPREPHILFSYWEVTPTLEAARQKEYGTAWTAAPLFLRVYNVDLGSAADTEIDPAAGSWHIPVSHADCRYRVELGKLLSVRRFVPLASSNIVRTPRDCLSAVIDPRWKMFAFWQSKYYRRMQQGLSSYLPLCEEN
jgi:hypothetical protein